jgi:glucose/arabinose dehydrogenase
MTRRARSRLAASTAFPITAAVFGLGMQVALATEQPAQTPQQIAQQQPTVAEKQNRQPQQQSDQAETSESQRPVNPADVQLPDGYEIEAVVKGLNFPSDITFGEDGTIYLSETGPHSYGLLPPQAPVARIVRLTSDGNAEVVYDKNVPLNAIREAEKSSEMPEGLIGPIEGITFNDENGLIYVAHRTRISTLDPQSGEFRTIIHDLPAWGLFHNNKVIFEADGRMIFGVAGQGNAGPVDKEMLQVIVPYQKFKAKEVPCEDVTLTGKNFPTPVPEPWPKEAPVQPDAETPDGKPAITSGAFVPLGEKTEQGQVIEGDTICNSGLFRADADGSNVERIAWGIRDSFEFTLAPDGRLIATNNSCNPIPPRPIFKDWETIYEIKEGEWYGWPDFCSGEPLTDPRFSDAPPEFPGKVPPHEFVLAEETHKELLGDREKPVEPLVKLPSHSATQGITFGPEEFGLSENEVLVANWGTLVPFQADMDDPPGFDVARVNLETGEIVPFAQNKSGKPASMEHSGGLERPLRVRFGPDGDLYIVDWGVMEFKPPQPMARLNTGVIWKVSRTDSAAAEMEEGDTAGLFGEWAGDDDVLTVAEWDKAIDARFGEKAVELSLEDWDRNDDGVISREEFDEAMNRVKLPKLQ